MARKASGVIGSSDEPDNSGNGNPGEDNSTANIAIEPGKPIVIDPVAATGSDGNGNDSRGSGANGGNDKSGASDPPRRRGRKPGSTNKKTSQSVHLDTDLVSGILLSTHQMLAAYSSIPELEIDEDESKKLATGIANVSRHYDTQVSAKALDWYYLIQVLVLVYGTRLYAIRQRKLDEKTENADVTEQRHSLRTVMGG